MTEKILLGLIVFLVFVLVIVLGIFSYMLFKMFQKQNFISESTETKNYHDDARLKIEQFKNEYTENQNKNFCVDHSELPAQGNCSISDEAYCELCLTKQDDFKIARKYLNLYLDSKWQELGIYQLEDLGADRLNEILKMKKSIWQKEQVPVLGQRQFKINVEHDKVEEYLCIKVREQDFERTQSLIQKII